MPTRRSLSASAGIVAAVVLVAGGVSLLPGAAPTASADALVPYTGCGELLAQYRDELARHAGAYGGPMMYGGVALDAIASTGVAQTAAAPAAAAAGRVSDEAGASTTGTNVQERGVDEPDSAKLAGGLLLTVSGNRVHVLRTGAQPELLSTYSLGENAWGAELLVQEDRVLVLVPDGGGGGKYGGPADMRMPVGAGPQRTRAVLLDLADPTSPRLLGELRLDGRYLSARLSDGAVRLVTSSMPVVQPVYPQAPYGEAQVKAALAANVAAARAATLDQVLPRALLRNGAGLVLSDERAVDCSQVRHAPSALGASTLLVTTLDLGRGLAPVDTEAVTTDGDLVYASTDRLYVATSRWGTTAGPAVQDDRPVTATATATTRSTVTTELHAFDTSSRTATRYAGSASVPGYVMGRWALSSYDGHLRVATTSAPPWEPGGGSSESGVTVLEERADALVETGSVAGLGKGEQVRAVRYFGDLATVVTFRQTDPLYVLDLGDPAAPAVVGELEVPGFSTYLHPVGDGLLLGVGQDADLEGHVSGVMAQVFDLRDLTHPVQVSKLILGQGYTQVLDESRAFGWDAEHRVALMPFSRWDGVDGRSSAVGIAVGEDGALTERGRLDVAGQDGVERVLHDASHVYAVSAGGIVAGDPATMARTGRVALPTR